MKIRMTLDHEGYNKGTIIDADELTAKEFTTALVAEEYTEVLEKKEAEELQSKIDAEVAKNINKKDKNMSTEKKFETVGTPAVEVVRDNSGDWKNMNEFLKAVKNAEESHIVDPRLITKASAGMGEDTNGIGGYLVQHPLWNQEIFNAYIGASVIAPKCRQFVAEDYANGLKFKQINETARTSNWFGGVQFYNVDEGSDITDSKPAFYQLDVPIKQLGAAYYITQALIDDCPSLSSYVAGLVGSALGQVLDREVLYGTLSIMTGAMGHTSTVSLPPAGTNPTAAELASMYNAMSIGSLPKAEWYMGHKQYAALMNLTSPTGSSQGSYPIFTKDADEPVKARLFGHPINVIEMAQTSNVAGSIVFADWSNYAIVTKGTMMPQVAMSLHVKFLSNTQTFRFIARVGGAPLLKSKVALLDGSNVSSVVST